MTPIGGVCWHRRRDPQPWPFGLTSVRIVAGTALLLTLPRLLGEWSAAWRLPWRTCPGAPTLQSLFAVALRPVMWLIGVPWQQSAAAAGLMGSKTVLNEFVAYVDLARLPPGALDARLRVIMTYALCGFANSGSVGILVGELGAMVPQRRAEIAALGLRALLTGTIATCLSGALAGLLS